ncbi:hypothetical protein AVO42_01235 [Thiomicrospira sp. XS5]|uniref:hypothetical protein n=1 Tax=Thiomicrospira sp. XS5 TaxID=1775636 RepID=UPI0007475622|nr:hypothetical protein [Thiomicrospira sp. XS5]KUJ74070.1 hypothetical protein AVO42_01235 [Thiomicrospira sp. XS5]
MLSSDFIEQVESTTEDEASDKTNHSASESSKTPAKTGPETAPDTTNPSAPPEKTYFFEGTESPLLNFTFKYLDTMHDWLSHTVDDFGEQADDFFGTGDSFDRTKGSRLDIMTPVRFHSDGSIDTQVKFRAKIALPKTQRRWHVIVSSAEDNIKELSSGGAGSTAGTGNNSPLNNASSATSPQQDDGTNVGLRYALDLAGFTVTFVDVGLNFRNVIEPDPYARIKLHYKWKLSPKWYSRMYQDLYWESYKGVGLNSRQVFDRQINNQFLFRSQTEADWKDKDQNYSLSQNFIFVDQVNVHRGLAYYLGWNWNWTPDAPGFNLSSYSVGVNWRERIYKDWMFFEIDPEFSFSDDTDFNKVDASIRFMLEAQFYDHK